MATTRSENIRELERALIGLDSEPGVKQHIERVLKTYTDAIEPIVETNKTLPEHEQHPIPESYIIICGALLTALDLLANLEVNINLARETM